MRIIKIIIRIVLGIISLPVLYFIISLLLSFITIDRKENPPIRNHSIFLHTNGVHLDIAIPTKHIKPSLLSGLKVLDDERFLSFGWGDENFYLNTPQWSDLTFENGFRALFLKSSSLMHITRYKTKQTDWIEIKLSDKELSQMMHFMEDSFSKDSNGNKIYLEDKGYTLTDDFYKANGSYSLFYNCNSWVNHAFKESGLKACLWTPFDFGLMNKYD